MIKIIIFLSLFFVSCVPDAVIKRLDSNEDKINDTRYRLDKLEKLVRDTIRHNNVWEKY